MRTALRSVEKIWGSSAASAGNASAAVNSKAAVSFISILPQFARRSALLDGDIDADMAGIFWTIHLYHKTVGIVELETFVVAARARRDGKTMGGDLGAHRLGVEAFQPEVVMVQRRRPRLLFDAEEALANTQDVNGL